MMPLIYLALVVSIIVRGQECGTDLIFPYAFGLGDEVRFKNSHTAVEAFAVTPTARDLIVVTRSTDAFIFNPSAGTAAATPSRVISLLSSTKHEVKWARSQEVNQEADYPTLAVAVQETEENFAIISGRTPAESTNYRYSRLIFRFFNTLTGAHKPTQFMNPGALTQIEFFSTGNSKAVYASTGFLYYTFNYVEAHSSNTAIYRVYENLNPAENLARVRTVIAGFNTLRHFKLELSGSEKFFLLAGGFEYKYPHQATYFLSPNIDIFDATTLTVLQSLEEAATNKAETGTSDVVEVLDVIIEFPSANNFNMVVMTGNKLKSDYHFHMETSPDRGTDKLRSIVGKGYYGQINESGFFVQGTGIMTGGDKFILIQDSSSSTVIDLIGGDFLASSGSTWKHVWMVEWKKAGVTNSEVFILYVENSDVRKMDLPLFISKPTAWTPIHTRNMAYLNSGTNLELFIAFNLDGSATFGDDSISSGNRQGFLFGLANPSKMCNQGDTVLNLITDIASRNPESWSDPAMAFQNNLQKRNVAHKYGPLNDVVDHQSQSGLDTNLQAEHNDNYGTVANPEAGYALNGRALSYCSRFFQSTPDSVLTAAANAGTYGLYSPIEGSAEPFDVSDGTKGHQLIIEYDEGGGDQRLASFGLLECKTGCDQVDALCGLPHLSKQTFSVVSANYWDTGASIVHEVSGMDVLLTIQLQRPFVLVIERKIKLSSGYFSLPLSTMEYSIQLGRGGSCSGLTDGISYNPAVDTSIINNFVKAPYMFVKKGEQKVYLYGPATKLFIECPVFGYRMYVAFSGQDYQVFQNLGVSAPDSNLNSQKLKATFTGFKRTSAIQQQWFSQKHKVELTLDMFDNEPIGQNRMSLDEFWSSVVVQGNDFFPTNRFNVLYHGSIPIKLEPILFGSSPITSKKFTYMITVIRCGTFLVPDNVIKTKERLFIKSAEEELFYLVNSANIPSEVTHPGLKFCATCGHTFCMDETLTGVPIKYIVLEFTDGAWTTSSKLTISAPNPKSGMMTWTFSNLKVGVFELKFYLENGFKQEQDLDRQVQFKLVVFNTTCIQPWDSQPVLSKSASLLSDAPLQVIGVINPEVEIQYFQLSPPTQEATIVSDNTKGEFSLEAADPITKVFFTSKEEHTYGASKTVLLLVGPNCFGQSVTFQITVSLDYCYLKPKLASQHREINLFAGNARTGEISIPDLIATYFKVDEDRVECPVQLALASDEAGAPLDASDLKIFKIEGGGLQVDPGSLAPNKDYETKVFLKAVSQTSAATVELSFAFKNNLVINTPPSIAPSDFGITRLSVNTSDGTLFKFTANVVDPEGDSISLQVQGTATCNCVQIILSSSTLAIEIDTSGVTKDYNEQLKVGLRDASGSGVTTWTDVSILIHYWKEAGGGSASEEDKQKGTEGTATATGEDSGSQSGAAAEGGANGSNSGSSASSTGEPVSDSDLLIGLLDDGNNSSDLSPEDTSQAEEEKAEAEQQQELNQASLEAVTEGGESVKAQYPPWASHASVQEVAAVWEEWKILLIKEKKTKAASSSSKKPTQPEEIKIEVAKVLRNGSVLLSFSEELIVPPFARPKTSGSKVLSSIRAEGTIFESELIIRSGLEAEAIRYYIDIISWTDIDMAITVNFSAPLLVSTGPQPDLLIITIKQPFYFISASTMKPLPEASREIIIELPRQFPPGLDPAALESQAAAASNSLMVVVILQIVLQLFLKNMLDDLWSLFFSLQLICYTKIYEVTTPSNAEVFLGEITNLIEFKALKLDNIVKLFWGPSMTAQKLVYKLLGTEESPQQALARGQTVIEELQVYILVLIVAGLMLVIASVLMVFRKLKPKITAKLTQLKQKMVWSGLIRSILISFFKFCILASSKVKTYLLYRSSEKVRSETDLATGLLIMAGTLSIPLLLVGVLSRFRGDLKTEEFRSKFKILTHDLRHTTSPWQTPGFWLFPSMFLRRWLFCLAPLIFLKQAYFQYQALVLMTLLFSMSYFQLKPQLDRARRRIEQINECLVAIYVYHLIIFTDFQPDPAFSFAAGYSLIVLVSAILAANLYHMVSGVVRGLRLKQEQIIYRAMRSSAEQPYNLGYWEAWTVRHFSTPEAKAELIMHLKATQSETKELPSQGKQQKRRKRRSLDRSETLVIEDDSAARIEPTPPQQQLKQQQPRPVPSRIKEQARMSINDIIKANQLEEIKEEEEDTLKGLLSPRRLQNLSQAEMRIVETLQEDLDDLMVVLKRPGTMRFQT